MKTGPIVALAVVTLALSIAGPGKPFVAHAADSDGDGIDDAVDGCPLVSEDADGIADADGCPDTDLAVALLMSDDYAVDVSIDVLKSINVTITNGNYAASARVTIVAISSLGQCEARFPGGLGVTTGFTSDEDGDGVDDTLWSEVQFTVPLAAGEVHHEYPYYVVHCFQRSQHSIEIRGEVAPQAPVLEEDASNNTAVHLPAVAAWDNADAKLIAVELVGRVRATCADDPEPPPAEISVGEPVVLCYSGIVHNNGPVTADAQYALAIAVPADCTVTPSSIVSSLSLVPSVTGSEEAAVTIACAAEGVHQFTADADLTVGGLHVRDPDDQNNVASEVISVNVRYLDSDGDGYGDYEEGAMGTDPYLACGVGAWPPDFDDSTVVNISDVFFVLPPYFGTSVPPTDARRDLVPDGVISISDVFKVLPPYFGWSCT